MDAGIATMRQSTRGITATRGQSCVTAASVAVLQQQLGRHLDLEELQLLTHMALQPIQSHPFANGELQGGNFGKFTNALNQSSAKLSSTSWPQGRYERTSVEPLSVDTIGGRSLDPICTQPGTNQGNPCNMYTGQLSTFREGPSPSPSMNGRISDAIVPAAHHALANGLPLEGFSRGMALLRTAATSRGTFGEGPRIYVGGVPDLVTVAMVRDHFSRWGVVRDVHFPKERTSRRRRHFCFVTFESLQGAERAVAESIREIGGYPVAAINIPTDRLTHYGIRQDGHGSSSSASPLCGTSLYNSIGCLTDPGSLRSASFTDPAAFNISTQQMDARYVQQAQPGTDRNFLATATQEELSVALAALKIDTSPVHSPMSSMPSTSIFPAVGRRSLYQNSRVGRSDGPAAGRGYHRSRTSTHAESSDTIFGTPDSIFLAGADGSVPHHCMAGLPQSSHAISYPAIVRPTAAMAPTKHRSVGAVSHGMSPIPVCRGSDSCSSAANGASTRASMTHRNSFQGSFHDCCNPGPVVNNSLTDRNHHNDRQVYSGNSDSGTPYSTNGVSDAQLPISNVTILLPEVGGGGVTPRKPKPQGPLGNSFVGSNNNDLEGNLASRGTMYGNMTAFVSSFHLQQPQQHDYVSSAQYATK